MSGGVGAGMGVMLGHAAPRAAFRLDDIAGAAAASRPHALTVAYHPAIISRAGAAVTNPRRLSAFHMASRKARGWRRSA